MGLKARLSRSARDEKLAQGRRVYLRSPARRDREAFLTMVAASRSFHAPWVSAPATAEHYSQYLLRVHASNALSFLVFRQEDDALVGVFNVSEIVRGPLQSGYLGYYGSERHSGQGYMSEGLALVLGYIFRQAKLHRLEANIQPDNLASRTLVARCGFRHEGFSPRYLRIAGKWRDHERWAITLEDWRKKL